MMRMRLAILMVAIGEMVLSTARTRASELIYVSMTNNTIVTYDVSLGTSGAVAASEATFASTNLSNPVGLAFDVSGNLYAANDGDDTISKFNSSGGFVSSISGNLSIPAGLAFDASGNLYAANSGNSTIAKFNSSGGFVSSISGNLNGPYGLAFDASGNLYAANFGDNTISKFDSAGTFQFSWSTGSATPAFLAFVPEPSTYALGGIAAGVMAILDRRRKGGSVH